MWLWGGLPAQSRITNHESPPALGGFARLFKMQASAVEALNVFLLPTCRTRA
jgi:hypothetical protein